MLVVTDLVLLFVFIAVNAVFRFVRRTMHTRSRKQSLEIRLKKRKERAKEVEAFEEYVKTDKYVKDKAKEKFGLVHPE